MARQKLTEEEKAAKLASKKERLQLQLAKIKSTEKREERKKRAKELIEIGAIISANYPDRTKLLEYLKGAPRWTGISQDGKQLAFYESKEKGGKVIFLPITFK
jgi:hypothetical protein